MTADGDGTEALYFSPADLLIEPVAVRALWCRRIDTRVLERRFKPDMTPQEMMECREALVAAVDYLSYPCFPGEENWTNVGPMVPEEVDSIVEDLRDVCARIAELAQLMSTTRFPNTKDARGPFLAKRSVKS